ncbi:Cellobiose 2-epimerase [Lacunisphaera limnophila]|uniref:Cellobiose 2-epimerase n=1 Tax=Lacunisphaera limnophila TaxID=1838286 RepID=A0A1D8AXJ9_9BACT|nr:thioredoxin domain-containing protein [Lacunisphaera limnophila]AOS45600.1 Cellobiose 2-epimerase [Lacunisphaera limnophila]
MPIRVFILCTTALLLVMRLTAAEESGNRLRHENSPYLLQHASQPVDWYPWGPEAFARARAENKLIFLSVGYSTCHWCHVMARESFADPATAALLNAHFICIKVDREERPDVDRVYQTFVQATTGAGGWPLTVWLSPELKPLFGGTYFPRDRDAGLPALRDISTRLADLWQQAPDKLTTQAATVWQALVTESRLSAGAGQLPVAELRGRGLAAAQAAFDPVHGGFEGAPKFPNPVMLDFLLDEAATAADPARRQQARNLATRSLHALAAGGIHDQLGGGFHRYAVDAAWRIPHFEKMLYDQAQLAGVFLTASQLTADPTFRDTAVDTLGYVRERLTAPEGGFYTAEDAESAAPDQPGGHAEGAFYAWTMAELTEVLGPGDAALFAYAYGLQPEGNLTAGTDPAPAGWNVLYRAQPMAAVARHFERREAEVQAVLDRARDALRTHRAARPRPLRDDKIVTAWNGLMISAFARAAQVLDAPEHAATAARAATFLHNQLRDPATGRLAHCYRAGRPDGRGFAEDYAFLIQGLLDLYEATFDAPTLAWAAELQDIQDQLFWDETDGGYFASTAGADDVLLRLKVSDDGAEPSPNSVAIRNLARLAALLHRPDWHARAARTARAFSAQLAQAPFSLPQMLAAIGWLEGTPQQILIQGEPGQPGTADLVREVWRRYLPRRVLVRIDRVSRAYLESRVEFIRALPDDPAGAPMAYVCENFVCRLPTGEPAILRVQLAAGEK